MFAGAYGDSTGRIALRNAAGAHVAGGPIPAREGLDPDHARGARRMDELLVRNGNSDMRRARRRRAEEHEVSPFDRLPVDRRTELILLHHGSGDELTLLGEDVGDKATAVEPGGVTPAVAVWRTAERECGPDQRRTLAGRRTASAGNVRGRRRPGLRERA